MAGSVESERPMLTKDNATRGSKRMSTYSKSPSAAASEKSDFPMPIGDPRSIDINEYTTSLERLDDKRLQEQRYIVSPEKEGDMSKLALAGKVERALNRRYHSQDAIMKPKKVSEKQL